MAGNSVKTILAIICSFLIGITIFILFSMNLLSPIYIYISFPFIAYGISFLFSIIHQYTTCNKVNVGEIAKSNFIILLANGFVSLLLWLESLPFLKYFFGSYPPVNPITGIAFEEGSQEYIKAFQTEDHYRIQPFSNVVKGVLPVVLEESTKTGLVALYWFFWATLIPHYFSLSMQGIC